MFRQRNNRSVWKLHTPVKGMLMAAANSGTGRGLLLWPCGAIHFLFKPMAWGQTWSCKPDSSSFTTAIPSASKQGPFWASRCWISEQHRQPCAPGPSQHTASGQAIRTLTTQMLERSLELCVYPRAPPKSESISNPPVLANSALGSRPHGCHYVVSFYLRTERRIQSMITVSSYTYGWSNCISRH